MRDNSKKFKVNLNLTNMKISSDKVLCKAGDSITLMINILEGDIPKDITNKSIDLISIATFNNGKEVKLEHKYSEGGIRIVDAAKGIVEIDTKPSFTQDSCMVMGEVVVYDENETVITNSFVSSIQPSNTRTIVKTAQDEVATLQLLSKTITNYNGELDGFKETMSGFETKMTTIESDVITLNDDIQAHEGVRVMNEDERVLAETNRTTMEVRRIEDETVRTTNEITRETTEEDRIFNENNRILAENIRTQREQIRDVAENIRQQTFEANETVRSQNEKKRIESDKTRDEKVVNWESSENARKFSETLRVRDESARVIAESQRNDGENIRNTQEENRQSTYNAFNNAEIIRVANEETRVANESGRVSSENTRIANENTRINAESSRQGVFEESQLARQTAYTESENARNTIFENNQIGMNSQYIKKEEGRGDKYVAAELSRRINYEESETHRDTQYTRAENSREGLYTSAETRRDTLYQNAEDERNRLFNIEENKRKADEVIRVGSESSRVTAENNRVVAENKRQEDYIVAETSRNTSYNSSEVERNRIFGIEEDKRKANESTRISGEDIRKSAETSRVSAETSRVGAETTRVNQENTRKSQETSRVNAESGRTTAETSRVEAEELRVQAEQGREARLQAVETKSTNNATSIAEMTKQLEGSLIDQNGVTQPNLDQRLDEDYAIIMDRFNKASLLPYEAEFISASNSYKGITKDNVVKGRTLQNLISFKFPTNWSISSNKLTVYKNIGKVNMLKPNTTYSYVILNVPNNVRRIYLGYTDGLTYYIPWTSFTSNCITFTTGNAILTNDLIPHLECSSECTIEQFSQTSLIILEGDYTNKPIPPYFEGIKSVNEEGENLVEVSCGKNLFNVQHFIDTTTSFNSLNQVVNEENRRCLSLQQANGVNSSSLKAVSINFKPNTQYTIQLQAKNGKLGAWNSGLVIVYNDNTVGSLVQSHSASGFVPISVTTVANKTVRYIGYQVTNSNYYSFIDLDTIMVKEGTTPTPYEPYQEHRLPLKMKNLRGIGNVCDTSDGVRRIGKVVLDGSETVNNWGKILNEKYMVFAIYNNEIKKSNNIVSDKYIYKYYDIATDKGEYITYNSGSNNGLFFVILTSKLTTQDINGFKSWLQANPTTVYYELATPTTEEGNTEELRTYDGVTNIFSEGSLIEPTISCKVPSNVQQAFMDLRSENQTLNNEVSTLQATTEDNNITNIETNLDQDVRLTMLELGL